MDWCNTNSTFPSELLSKENSTSLDVLGFDFLSSRKLFYDVALLIMLWLSQSRDFLILCLEFG
jgi:hypothetical protein